MAEPPVALCEVQGQGVRDAVRPRRRTTGLTQGGGMGSSRASAAAQAAAARTPSTVRVGYWASIWSSVIPAARQSSTTLTGILVPEYAPGRVADQGRGDQFGLLLGHAPV